MATVSAYFSGIESEIISCLDEAKSSVIVVVAWFKNEKLFSALSRCLHRGVDVHIAINNDEINFAKDGLEFSLLQKHGAKIYLIGGSLKALVHHKFCIIDNATVISGSYNWTHRANHNHENIILLKEAPFIAKSYTSEFYNLIKSFDKLIDTKNSQVPSKGSIEALAWWDNLSSDWKCVFADKIKANRFSIRAKQIDEILSIEELRLTDDDITEQGLSASGKIVIDSYVPLYALQKLKKLDIRNNSLHSLSFLNSLDALEELAIESSKLISFDELKSCKSIKTLKVVGASEFSMISIGNAPNLSKIELKNIDKIKLNGIGLLSALKIIYIHNSNVENFSSLAQLSKLEIIDFYKVKVDELNFDSSMPTLKTLRLVDKENSALIRVLTDSQGNPLFKNLERLFLERVQNDDDLMIISKFESLNFLSICNSKINNLNFLMNLNLLEELNLERINNIDISPLLMLPELKMLIISQMHLNNVISTPNYLANVFRKKHDVPFENTKAEIIAFKEKKQNCKVQYIHFYSTYWY